MALLVPTDGHPSFSADTPLAEMLKKVEAGEQVTITRQGEAIAHLVPARKKASVAERRAAIQRLHELRKGLSLGGLKIKDLISEGRK